MASIHSLYSEAVTASVQTDTLSPKAPTFGSPSADASQSTSGEVKGKTLITIYWVAPTLNEKASEFLGAGNGSIGQVFETLYDPISSDSQTVVEITDLLGGGDTTLASGTSPGMDKIDVASAASFAVSDWIQISETITGKLYKNYYKNMRNCFFHLSPFFYQSMYIK